LKKTPWMDWLFSWAFIKFEHQYRFLSLSSKGLKKKSY